MSYSDEVLADTPVAYWRLGTGSTDVDDASGNGHTFTKTGSPTEVASIVASQSDGARNFPGDNSARYDAADHANFDTLNTASFSIEAWVKFDAVTASFKRIIGHEDASNGWHLGVHSTDGIFFNRRAGGTGHNATYPAGATTGVTFHVVGTYDGSNMRLYVDKVLRDTEAVTDNMAAVGNTVRTGPFTGSAQVDGTADEIAFYTSALSLARIEAHYDAGVVAAAAPTLHIVRSPLRW